MIKWCWECWTFTVHTLWGFPLLNDQRQGWALWHLRDSCHSSLVLSQLKKSCQSNKLLDEQLARLSWPMSCFEHFVEELIVYSSCQTTESWLLPHEASLWSQLLQMLTLALGNSDFSHKEPQEPVKVYLHILWLYLPRTRQLVFDAYPGFETGRKVWSWRLWLEKKTRSPTPFQQVT